MDLALENNCRSISFCGISTGVYGYPIEEAVVISKKAVEGWFRNHPDADIEVYFCCFNDDEYDAYTKAI